MPRISEMSEGTYRSIKSILLAMAVLLLAILVVGALVIGAAWAENGRYMQVDYSKSFSPDGRTRYEATESFDTRTGVRSVPH